MATEIAHEVGTPLAVVRGRAEQVARQVGAGQSAEDLRVIIKQVDQISSTIRQLLDFSRRSPFETRSVALPLVVEHTRELLLVKLEARRLRLDVKLNYTHLPWRQSDQKFFVADNSKAGELISWAPMTPKEDGIESVLTWELEKQS